MASGVGGRTIPGLFLKNVWDNTCLFTVGLTTMAGSFFGAMGGGIYSDSQIAPTDLNIGYGLEATHDSYQGLGDHLIEYDADTGQYAIYEPRYSEGDPVEFQYQQDVGAALGELYNIRNVLLGVKDDFTNGKALTDDQKSYFFALDEMTILYEEEEDSIERDFSEVARGSGLTDREIANPAAYLIPMINDAFDQIIDQNQYGLSKADIENRPDIMSADEGLGKGALVGLALTLSLLSGIGMLNAGAATNSQMRTASEKRKKQSSKLTNI
jgi:hypothetical protein